MLEPASPVTRSQSNRDVHNKHLIFTLGNEEFGIQVLHVKEIMQMQEITPVPQTPEYVRGVIDLRGQVIPGGGSDSSFRHAAT